MIQNFFLLFVLLWFSLFGAQPDSLRSLREELENKKGTDSKKPTLEILNVSYDPTREFYEKYDDLFAKWWKDKTNQEVAIIQSHGGSGAQARAVISGLDADVVTLALSSDIDAIEQFSGLVGEHWQNRLPNKSVPYFSTIIFVVRKGNPKQIFGWKDLARNGVQVILPNPKISGGARWSYLAAWGWAEEAFHKDRKKIMEYLQRVYANVPALDAGARASTTTFVQREMGDVLVTWENEAQLLLEKTGSESFEMVYPSISIRTEPPVAWLEKITQQKGTEDVSEFYLKYLYSIAAQELIARFAFRPYEEGIAKKFEKRFPKIKMFSVENFGGWKAIEKEHFKDGGIFDEIFLPSKSR